DAVFDEGYDAVISLCRMGSEMLDAEHVEFWPIDDGPAVNVNLDFLLDDAARAIRMLRAERRTVGGPGVGAADPGCCVSTADRRRDLRLSIHLPRSALRGAESRRNLANRWGGGAGGDGIPRPGPK